VAATSAMTNGCILACGDLQQKTLWKWDQVSPEQASQQ
jgi:hypothetical protein